MKFLSRKIQSLLSGAIIMASAAAGLSSCDVIYDKLDPCPQGLVLRFVYDYNMEFANAFYSQVDCLTLLVYDEHGQYVTTRTVTDRDLLKDEDWRMTIDLPEGHYQLLAYGGMACKDASFEFVNDPATTPLTDIEVRLDPYLITPTVGRDLHNLFYGFLDADVEQGSLTYNEYTLYMMRDTNDIRVILQQIDGGQVDNNDFIFSLIDDNTLMAWNNEVVPTAPVTFYPWAQGQESVGLNTDGGEIKVAYAEFCVPRLVTSNNPRIRITHRSDGSEVLDIPLINYLKLLRSEHFNKMSPQEYLDRENQWALIFFLDSHWRWVQTHIVINDWVVRLNNAEI